MSPYFTGSKLLLVEESILILGFTIKAKNIQDEEFNRRLLHNTGTLQGYPLL